MKNKDCMIVKAGLWILLIANVISFFVTSLLGFIL